MSLIDQWLESLDYEYVILDHCSRRKSPFSTCTLCQDSCLEDALTIENNQVTISKDKCTECTKCLIACPVQAIGGIFPKREFSKNHLIADDKKLPSAKELLIYHKHGVQEIVLKNCNNQELWLQALDEANAILAQMDQTPIVIDEEYEVKQAVYSRRDLFSLWKTEGKSLAKEITPAKWRFNHTDFRLNKHYPEYQFHTIELDTNKCIVCSACEKLCPDQCFTISDSSFMINQQPCQGCQLCVEICKEKALTITREIKKAETITLPLEKKRCTSCRQFFLTFGENEGECFVCKKRKALFGNSLLK